MKNILDAIEEIERYLTEVDFRTFIENSMMIFACIKQMEIIGEASNHVSQELKSKFTDGRMGSECRNAKCICT